MKVTAFANTPLDPSRRNLAFQLFVPDHLAAGGLVGLAVLVGEVELHKPIVVDGLRQRLQFGYLLAVQLDLLVETSENARYEEVSDL